MEEEEDFIFKVHVRGGKIAAPSERPICFEPKSNYSYPTFTLPKSHQVEQAKAQYASCTA